MKTPILGSSYVARSVNAADNRMVNLFPEIIPEGGKEPAFLSRTPGMIEGVIVGSGPIRGIHAWSGGNGLLLVVSGDNLYRVNVPGGAILIGDVSGGVVGLTLPVSFAEDGERIVVTTGQSTTQCFVFDTTTYVLTQVTDIDYQGFACVTYLDGFFVFAGKSQNTSQIIQSSALLDPTVYDPLDFASAEASPDGVVSVIANHGELWVFGTNSTEVWYNAGNPGFPFSRIQGSFSEVGCAARFSVAKLDNSVFWLGSDSRGHGIVYRTKGYGAERVSTHGIEWQIQRYSRIDDAVAYTYQQDGHAFYVINFPSGNATWVYDVATGAWHERAYWDGTNFNRHRGNAHAFTIGTDNQAYTVIGDWENGRLSYLDPDTYTDNGVAQKWLRSWRALPPGANNLKRTAQHSLQVDCETGVGNGDVPDPQMTLRFSDDGGHTWSNARSVSMGADTTYSTRVIWRRLGMTTKLRDRVYEVSGTDAVKIFITGAELHLSPTNA